MLGVIRALARGSVSGDRGALAARDGVPLDAHRPRVQFAYAFALLTALSPTDDADGCVLATRGVEELRVENAKDEARLSLWRRLREGDQPFEGRKEYDATAARNASAVMCQRHFKISEVAGINSVLIQKHMAGHVERLFAA